MRNKGTKGTEGEKDGISMTGIIIYCIVLIAVAFLVYFIIGRVFAREEKAAKKLAEEKYNEELSEKEALQALAKEEAETETETESEPEPEVVEEEEEEDEESEEEEKEVDISDFYSSDGTIDYSIYYFLPGKRVKDAKWSDKVFSKIENVNEPENALVNTYDFSRRHFISDKEKEIECCLYYDPSTGFPAKITAIENCGNYYEITDYYFDTDGKLNYADSYTQKVVVPSDPGGNLITSRYYIENDTLIRYIYSKDSEALAYSLKDYEKYSSGTKEQYDYLEKEIINKAYVTYHSCISATEKVTIEGYVQDEFKEPLQGVSVTIDSEDEGAKKRSVKTDGDGHYTFKIDASDVDYHIDFHKDSLVDVSFNEVRPVSGSGTIYLDTIYLGYSDNIDTTYNVQVIVRDAIDNNKPLDGAGLRLRAGINNRDGVVFASGNLDMVGALDIPLSSGMYTAEVEKEGYELSYFTITVRNDSQSVMGFAVPEVSEGSYMVFSYWSTSPLDLDSRFIGEYGKNVIRASADSIGSVNTESFILNDIGSQPYQFFISDYISSTAGNPMSYNMSESGAYVKIYSSEGLISSFTVPAGHAGVVWNPMTIRNGRIYPDNRYYYSIDTDLYWTSK